VIHGAYALFSLSPKKVVASRLYFPQELFEKDPSDHLAHKLAFTQRMELKAKIIPGLFPLEEISKLELRALLIAFLPMKRRQKSRSIFND